MATILFIISENRAKEHGNRPTAQNPLGEYLVDGKKPNLPADVVELTIVPKPLPVYDVNTQKIDIASSGWQADLNTLEYHYVYVYEPLSALELASIEWKHKDYPVKLVINEAVAESDKGVKHFIRFQEMGNPIEYDNVTKKFTVWVLSLGAEYAADLGAFVQSGEITVTNRPTILD